MNAGVTLSDAVYVIFSVFISSSLIQLVTDNLYFKILGFTVFIAFGLNYLFKKKSDVITDYSKISHGKCFIKGFLINMINPFVPVLWVGSVLMVMSNYNLSNSEALIFFSATLTSYFLMNALKIYFASKLKRFLDTHKLHVINKITGVFLIAAGIYILIAKNIQI